MKQEKVKDQQTLMSFQNPSSETAPRKEGHTVVKAK